MGFGSNRLVGPKVNRLDIGSGLGWVGHKVNGLDLNMLHLI